MNPEENGVSSPQIRDLAEAGPVSLGPEVAEKSRPSVHRMWFQPGVGRTVGGKPRRHPALEHQLLWVFRREFCSKLAFSLLCSGPVMRDGGDGESGLTLGS